MKVTLSQFLHTINGEVFKDKDAPVTLASVIHVALTASYADEPQLTGAEKYARYELASRLKGQDEADISTEEAAKIKLLVGKFYHVEVVGAAYDAIEGKKQPASPTPTAPKSSGRGPKAVA